MPLATFRSETTGEQTTVRLSLYARSDSSTLRLPEIFFPHPADENGAPMRLVQIDFSR